MFFHMDIGIYVQIDFRQQLYDRNSWNIMKQCHNISSVTEETKLVMPFSRKCPGALFHMPEASSHEVA